MRNDVHPVQSCNRDGRHALAHTAAQVPWFPIAADKGARRRYKMCPYHAWVRYPLERVQTARCACMVSGRFSHVGLDLATARQSLSRR